MMQIRPIHTSQDYELALSRIEQLMDSQPGREEFDELDILATLVEAYEEKHFPIEGPDPVEAIKFRMEQFGMKRSDLERVIHCERGRVSEILNKRRPLTLKMIRSLSKEMNIPPEILVQEYELSKST